MIRRLARCVIAAVVLGPGSAGCVPAASCDMAIIPAAGPGLDAVPAGVDPIITTADIDPLGWRVIPDEGTGVGDQVVFRLDAEGAERFGAFTRENVGGWMAVVIDGRVVSVPMITGPMDHPEVALTGADEDWIEDFRKCLPIELLPTG